MLEPTPPLSFRELQFEAKERAAGFLQQAAVTGDARDAASWSSAARNAVEVALKCEQIVATKAKR